MSECLKNPEFSHTDAENILMKYYSIEIKESKSLNSYIDQNFYILSTNGNEYVLKISNKEEKKPNLVYQHNVLKQLSKVNQLKCPIPVKSINGEEIIEFEGHLIRLLTFINGELYANSNIENYQLYFNIGKSLAYADKALMDFNDHISSGIIDWDLKYFQNLKKYISYIDNAEQKSTIQKVLDLYGQNEQKINILRKSVIHNDVNDSNLLIDKENYTVIGYIDYGDSTYTYTICDLAICLTYCMFDKKDPLQVAYYIIMGFNHILEIQENECELIYLFIIARCATSLLISSFSSRNNTKNEYITSGQKQAWELLQYLTKKVNSKYVYYLFRQACKYKEIFPKNSEICNYLNQNKSSFHSIFKIDFNNPKNFLLLDLSNSSEIFYDLPKNSSYDILSEKIFSLLKKNNARIGIGKYLENRDIYQTDNYNDFSDRRTIHLGQDLYIEAGTEVFSPLDGEIHSFSYRDIDLDYGPVIILKHRIENQLEFFTLYGHLSLESLKELYKGKKILKGEKIGTIGESKINGNWPPHVHFQIIFDMLDKEGDYIGVAAPSKIDLWSSICPNPNLILNINESVFSESFYSKIEILEKRRNIMGKSLSISYKEPLVITRGLKQYLYTDQGIKYLDCVNNVAHIGHSHPRIIKAQTKQIKLLNTNTRYLNSEILLFIEELLSTLPEKLNVCFLTCSGSEANDLALRLARNYTNRKDIVALDHAYHGNLTSLIEISPYKFKGKGGFNCPDYIHIADIPDSFRGKYRYDDENRGVKYGNEIKEIFDKFECAAFIAESVLGCGGQIVLPPNYLKTIYKHAKEHGIITIADEVQVGFGRVGSKMWAFETQDVIPDILTLGKPIGNGHPMAACITTREIADKFNNGMEYFNTFGGNNVSCIIGREVLKIIKDEKLQENAYFLGEILIEGFNKLKNKYNIIGDVRGLGLFIGVELVRNKELEPADKEADFIIEYLRTYENILLSTDGPYHNVLKIKPPLCINIDDCLKLINGVERALKILEKK